MSSGVFFNGGYSLIVVYYSMVILFNCLTILKHKSKHGLIIIILFLLVDSYQMVATIRYMPVDISDYIRLYTIIYDIERIEREHLVILYLPYFAF